MAKQNARKVVSKSTTKADREKTDLTPAEQKMYNKEWERTFGKLKPGEKASVSEQAYAEWKKTGTPTGVYNKGEMPKPEKVSVGTLPIKKATTIPVKSDGIQKTKYKVPVAIERPGKGGALKTVTGKKAGSSFGKKVTKNVGLTGLKGRVKGAVENARFNREEKLAGAYQRNKAGLSGTSKEKVAELKGQRKYLRSKEMLTTGAGTTDKSRAERAQTLAKERKSLRQAERYVKKEVKGKVKYFTQDAMNKTQDLTSAQIKKMKGTKQAGKTRYSS